MTMASRGQMWPPLAQAPIPIRPVGPALVCVCEHLMLNSLSGRLCLACYRQPPLLCPGDGWTLVWMFHGSLGCRCTFQTRSSSLPFSAHLSLSLTLEINSHIPLYDYCVYSVFFFIFILPFVWSGICPMHLSSEYQCVALAWASHLEHEC